MDISGVTANFNRRKAVSCLSEALARYAATENIPLVTLKDFPADQRSDMAPLLGHGFTRLDGFPPLKLDLNFATFEQYLSQRLSKITRKGLRRKFRDASAAASPAITMEVQSDCRPVIDEIYPLYLAVAERSAVQFEVFTRQYFIAASLTMPERSRFFIWRQDGKAIAFSYCTIWNGTIFDNDIGLDLCRRSPTESLRPQLSRDRGMGAAQWLPLLPHRAVQLRPEAAPPP